MDRRRPRLVLLTESFPFPGPDDPFLPREADVLSRHFDLHVVPTGPITDGDLHGHFDPYAVDLRLANFPRSVVSAVRGMFAGEVSRELQSQSSTSMRARALVARRWTRVCAGRRWAQQYLVPQLGGCPTLVYSWWGVPEAVGVAEQLQSSGVPMVTRMHGYDLYGEQDRLGFIPFQRHLIESVDKVFSASQAGRRYLSDRYPEVSGKFSVAHLGVDKALAMSPASNDGVFRIVSCSRIVPVKRLDLLVDALLILKSRGVKFAWTHIGDGPERMALEGQAAPLGERAHFLGELPHDQVVPWLTRHPIDVFCNVSQSEGLPVTLMEAASCGIPLLASDVGGNSEIVDDSVGRLIPGSTGPQLVADALIDMSVQLKSTSQGWRRKSVLRWSSTFDAKRNYEWFARELMNILVGNGNLEQKSARMCDRRETP